MKPFMDHAGVHIRHETTGNQIIFAAIPNRAVALGWRTVTQGGPVHCCHTQVAAKQWVYRARKPLSCRVIGEGGLPANSDFRLHLDRPL